MKISDRLAFPTNTARVCLFQPTRRPVTMEWTTSTSWGEAHVSGSIGQVHADVLDVLYHEAERRTVAGDEVRVAIDCYRVQSRLGINRARLDRLLSDLMSAEVYAMVPAREIRVREHLVARVLEANLPPPDPRRKNTFQGNRVYLRVDFGLVWSQFLLRDLQTHYDPILLSMRYGISQALARFCLGHKSVSDTVPGIFQKMGARRRIDKLLHELAADANTLERLSIKVNLERETIVYPAGFKTENGRKNPEHVHRNSETRPQKLGKHSLFSVYDSYVSPRLPVDTGERANKLTTLDTPPAPVYGKSQ